MAGESRLTHITNNLPDFQNEGQWTQMDLQAFRPREFLQQQKVILSVVTPAVVSAVS